MATTRLGALILKDKSPGVASMKKGIPVDGWTGATHFGVTAPTYPPGEKRAHFTDNSHNPGWYTMFYGAFAEWSGTNHCISADISDGLCWVAHTCMTQDVSYAADPTYISAVWDGSLQPWYVVSSCTTASSTKDVSGCGMLALPCGSLDGGQYGWFWCGGVCPCKDVTFLDDVSASGTGADLTSLGVVSGGVHLCQTGGTCMLTSQDWSNTIDATIPNTEMDHCGWATESDA